MDRLAADYDAVTAAGGQVKVVVQSAPERVREAMGEESRFPFDVICDPERTLYERFSVFPADTMFDLAGDDLQALLPMAASMLFGSGREAAVGSAPGVVRRGRRWRGPPRALWRVGL